MRSCAEDGQGPNLNWPMRILVMLVGLVVLAVAAVICVVIVGAQVGFYETHLHVKDISFSALGIDRPLHLPVFTPLATEGIVWATTLLAVVMVLLNRPATLWTQSMWFFASIAAFVNSWYAIQDQGDLFGGILRGGLSLAGPFLVHLFILWCRHLRTGRTLVEARISTEIRWAAAGRFLRRVLVVVGQHLLHPLIALRALDYRLGVGHWTYTEAWAAASLDYRLSLRNRINKTARKHAEQDNPAATDRAADNTVETQPRPAADRVPDRPPVMVPAVIPPDEIGRLLDRFNADDLTADDFADQRKGVAEAGGRNAAETRPSAASEAAEPRPDQAADKVAGAAGPRKPRRPTRRLGRLSNTAGVDVSDLLSAAREVADELGGRLSRDLLVAGLRSRGLTVGGRRKAAIYDAIRAEREQQ